MLFVKPGQRRDVPALPLVVRMPSGRLLRSDGENVPDTTFWHRRLRDGDVVEAAAPQPPSPKAAAAQPAAGAPGEPRTAVPALIALAGEPLRLTAAEWARVPALGPPDGPAVVGVATAEAIHERDPAAPLLTHDEYLAEIRK